ncbi:neutral/alkaline non-lysosomal ceramidase N-terminal domain-containing protein [Luteolibacter ambystomatis]|uniref:Neutral/alkaline non-lysosomal ceramidase N-terminal domain-containing protein n=1 Tax=Luteolibacter ambystomatis TaxID=2824561 RepID=A0A975J0Z7_9BACT|nr:neutral/alkaline non-lysosomal ceramidase N-terminal domain-containing protein [Luteolibacter ambystomatis]QUE52027.1 neutral/alkaline non-lysosomal ceramidase N-terminal domain-containing protein [Luteolibacter ambystomatis]
MARLGRLALYGVAVVALLVVVSVKPVDREPYFTTHYHEETRRHFEESVKTYRPGTGALKAGFGKARLSPELRAAEDDPEQGKFKWLPMAGYNSRGDKPTEGIHDDLWAKAVAMEVSGRRLVMLRLDALIIPHDVSDAVVKELSARHGLKREEIYFSATHTHSGIGGWGPDPISEAFSGGYNAGIPKWFVRQLVTAADDALGHMEPASLGGGRFHEPDYVRNRLAKTWGRVDDEFSYLLLKQQGGTTGVIGVYNAHATCLSGENMKLSADYPGYWERRIEEKTGGFAMYMAGAVGSHGPEYGYRDFEGARKMGEALADDLLKRLPETKLESETTLGAFGLDLGLPESQVRVTDTWCLRPTVTSRLIPVEQQTYLQVVRLGDGLWFSTPCDFSGELALDLKAPLELRGYHATVTSFNGDYIGYVVPQHYFDYTKYESRAMSFYGPYVSPHFMDWMRRMADMVAK